ncbi:MAG: long-chain fatty acid--CoA ligase [Elusimicrobia bacterium]|nr:long-chain fatty acid--CoA ligase [Elusimicrobiota bacterium]
MIKETPMNNAPVPAPPAENSGGPFTLSAMLEMTALSCPSNTALLFEGKKINFQTLSKWVGQASAAFAGKGVQKGDCVILQLRNSPEFIVAYFALARLGARAVPVNFLVKKSEELAYIFNHCGAAGALTQNEFLSGVLGARKLSPGLRHVWSADGRDAHDGVQNFWDFIQGFSPGDAPAVEISPEDVATILYTSGTTGQPKGVMLTHQNLVSNVRASVSCLNLSRRDVFLCILPMFHTFAWTACVLTPIYLGAPILVVASITPAAVWLKQMLRHGATLFPAMPQIFAVLSKEAKGFKRLFLKYLCFRKVRFAISGSAPLAVHTLEEFEAKLGVPIQEGYGLTETSPAVSINPAVKRKIGSVGTSMPGVSVKIFDEDDKELAAGAEGEICVKGPNVMKGYYKDEEATRAAFNKSGWFKTGDIGIIDEEGYIFIRDRKKDMIIVKGLKVFPAQLEAVLSGHPDIDEAAVIGVPDSTGSEKIKAFVVLKKGSQMDKAQILHFCKQKLDPYKRPRDVEIVPHLPKNALQKVLKRKLREQEMERAKSIES